MGRPGALQPIDTNGQAACEGQEESMAKTIRITAHRAKRNPIARSFATGPVAAKVFVNRKRSPRRGRWPDHADWAEF
jgi:hypothetical protein